MKKILFLAGGLLLAGCGVNANDARRALEAQGMSDVQIGNFAWFGCGRDDEFASYFTAIGANGKPVSGTVCSGWWKGVTVRYD